jgi:tetratricopeptide (TPR) repeat protein
VSDEPSNIALRYIQRRVLLLSLIPLGLLFVVTVALARTYHAREAALAGEWLRRGNHDFSAGRAAAAVDDFRNALPYDPDNSQIRLRLAEALLNDGRLTEATAYFQSLWDQNPGSGEVNLDLARISAQMGDVVETVRHYREAIYGGWELEPARGRTSARLELCEFLVRNGRLNEAREELTAAAADAPQQEAILHEQIGNLFLKAGDQAKAVQEFEAALQTDPGRSLWLEEAGKAAYAGGDYQTAETYLSKANRENPSPDIGELLSTAGAIVRGDPYLPGLSDEEKTRRSWSAFERGLERLQSCVAVGGAQSSSDSSRELENLTQSAKQLKDRVNLRSLIGQPDLRIETMSFVFRIEKVTSDSCRTPAGFDKALLLIGKKYEGTDP